MTLPLTSLGDYFAGHWQIVRRVLDKRANATARLEGCAVFTTAAAGLRYDETGILRFGAHEGPAAQNYLYVPRGSAAEVRFGDGRFFHAVDLASGRAETEHLCGEDFYRGRYRLLGPDCWWLAWAVTGPRKDYLMATRHLRKAPSLAYPRPSPPPKGRGK